MNFMLSEDLIQKFANKIQQRMPQDTKKQI